MTFADRITLEIQFNKNQFLKIYKEKFETNFAGYNNSFVKFIEFQVILNYTYKKNGIILYFW